MTTTELGPFVVSEDLSLLDRLFEQSPAITAFHARVMLGRWFATHYRQWSEGLTPRLRRMTRRGVYQYWLDPDPKARNDLQVRRAVEAQPDLDRIQGKGVVRSEAGLLLERGGTVRPKSGRMLAVPTGKYRRMSGDRRRALIGLSPSDYAAKNPDNPLFVLGRKRAGSRVAVLARQTGRQLASGKQQVEPVYLLMRSVRVDAQLGVVRAWDAMGAYRERTLEEARQRIVAELAKRLDQMPRTGGVARRGLSLVA